MAASLMIPNTAFAAPIAPKPVATDPNCPQKQQGNDFYGGVGNGKQVGGNLATTRMHYTTVEPGSPRYKELLASVNSGFSSKNVHCEEGSPIYATQTASGLFPQIDGKTKNSEVAITDPGNWSTAFPKDALKRFVTNKRKLANYQGIKTQKELIVDAIDPTSNIVKKINANDASKTDFLDDMDPDVQDKKEQEFKRTMRSNQLITELTLSA